MDQVPPRVFRLNDEVAFQKIDGFGASLLEAGLVCINSLPAEKQEDVLRALFDGKKGAGFSAMKTVIGGTDFQSAGPFFTYNDEHPGDTEMKYFSIARDLVPNGEITFIKRARKYGKFMLQAPMDYPPDWMLKVLQDRKAQDVDPKYYDALALYYLRYLQAYKRNGITLDYLSLFNEPGVYTKIPYHAIRDLLKDHVGPLLAKNKVKTKIQLSEAPTCENAFRNYPTVMDDPDARKYVGGLAYHGYDWKNPKTYDQIATIHKRYPEYQMWMTEVCYAYEAGYPTNSALPRYDFEDGDFWGNMIMSDLEAGAAAWIYWNMILDEKGGPWCVSEVHGNPDPNCQHPVVIINRQTHEVTYTGLYYYLTHFSKFVRPGAQRIEVKGEVQNVRCVAFKKAAGKHVVEIINSGKTGSGIYLDWEGKFLPVVLSPVSITTLVW
jgi:glucosylceramidase